MSCKLHDVHVIKVRNEHSYSEEYGWSICSPTCVWDCRPFRPSNLASELKQTQAELSKFKNTCNGQQHTEQSCVDLAGSLDTFLIASQEFGKLFHQVSCAVAVVHEVHAAFAITPDILHMLWHVASGEY